MKKIVTLVEPRHTGHRVRVVNGLCDSLRALGRRVVVVDFDPEASFTLHELGSDGHALAAAVDGTSAAWLHAWGAGVEAGSWADDLWSFPNGDALIPASLHLDELALQLAHGALLRGLARTPVSHLRHALDDLWAEADIVLLLAGTGLGALPRVLLGAATAVVALVHADASIAGDVDRVEAAAGESTTAGRAPAQVLPSWIDDGTQTARARAHAASVEGAQRLVAHGDRVSATALAKRLLSSGWVTVPAR